MINTGKPVFLQIGDESQDRVLHAGKVLGVADNTYTCEIARKEEISCQEGDAASVYFENDRTFVRQSARICSIAEAESRLEITLETTSDPIFCEIRRCHRVSTVILDITVTVADEKDCPLLDISATGMCAITTSRHKVGAIVPVVLSYDGRKYTGKAMVRSDRELGEGRFRQGFHCVEDHRCRGNLQQGTQKVSASVRRLLISRMSLT